MALAGSQTYALFDPTALFGGVGPYRHRAVQVGQASAILLRGTLLGRQSASGVASAAGTNTGNGTLTLDGSAPLQANVQPGAYTVKFTSATAYNVFDPKGNELGQGANGAAFSDQIKFVTAAGGTAFVAGDSFTVTVANPDQYIPCVKTATDGSQIPCAILAGDIDTTAGAAMGPAYFEGDFIYEAMTVDSSWSASTVRAAARQNNIPLYIRSAGQLG